MERKIKISYSPLHSNNPTHPDNTLNSLMLNFPCINRISLFICIDINLPPDFKTYDSL